MNSLILFLLITQVNWTKYPAPVIYYEHIWEYGVGDPTLIYEDSTYKVWYTGAGVDSGDTVLKVRICAAQSSDCLNWKKYGVVLQNGDTNEWDHGGVETATVVHNGTGYHMWFDGYKSRSYMLPISFGYAFSTDGLSWTKYSKNPVLQGTPGEWDNHFMDSPSVIFENDTFKMWYSGADSVTWNTINIGLAYSTDGINWTKYPKNPVFSASNGNTWDSSATMTCSVKHFGNLYEMWYAGWRLRGGNWPPDTISIGYATSPDGINWTKYPKNPVLKQSSVSWDSLGVAAPDVVLTTKYEMLYDGGLYEIGYASAPIAIEEPVAKTVEKFQLFQNYPNPFTKETEIKWSVTSGQNVGQSASGGFSLAIYDLSGKLVRSFPMTQLPNDQMTTITWDGKDNKGKNVEPGMYFYRLEIRNKFSQTRKMVLLKRI